MSGGREVDRKGRGGIRIGMGKGREVIGKRGEWKRKGKRWGE